MYVPGNANPAGEATVVNRVTEVNPASPYSCVRFWWYATAINAPQLYVLAKRYDMPGNMYKRLWWATSYPGWFLSKTAQFGRLRVTIMILQHWVICQGMPEVLAIL